MNDNKNLSRLPRIQHEITLIYPSGVSQLILGYFVDKVIITAEYHWAVYEGNVPLLRQIDKEYKHLLVFGSYSATEEEYRAKYLFALLRDALDHDQIEAATYLRQQIGAEVKDVWEMQDERELIDKAKQEFLMDMVDEKRLMADLYREMRDHNNIHYVKRFLQRFPHYRFRLNELELGRPIVFVGELSDSMVYILLRYAEREDVLAATRYYFDSPFYRIDILTCLLYAFNIDYTICQCQRYLMIGKALEQGITVCRKCKVEEEGDFIDCLDATDPVGGQVMRGPVGYQG